MNNKRIFSFAIAIAIAGILLISIVAAMTVSAIGMSESMTATTEIVVTGISILMIVALYIAGKKKKSPTSIEKHSASYFGLIGITRTTLIFSVFIFGNNTTHRSHWYFDRAA